MCVHVHVVTQRTHVRRVPQVTTFTAVCQQFGHQRFERVQPRVPETKREADQIATCYASITHHETSKTSTMSGGGEGGGGPQLQLKRVGDLV